MPIPPFADSRVPTRLIMLVTGPDGDIAVANSYTDPARALLAAQDATNDHEHATILPAQAISEADFGDPAFLAPLATAAARRRVHIADPLDDEMTMCGLRQELADRWMPVLEPSYREVCPECLCHAADDPEVPMPLTPAQLYDAIAGELERASLADHALAWRPVLRLNRPTVQIRGRTWRARTGNDATGYGYTARQARQMRRALLAVMADRNTAWQAILFDNDQMGI